MSNPRCWMDVYYCSWPKCIKMKKNIIKLDPATKNNTPAHLDEPKMKVQPDSWYKVVYSLDCEQLSMSPTSKALPSPAMGHWDTCPLPSTSVNFFSRHFRAAQTRLHVMWLPIIYRLIALSCLLHEFCSFCVSPLNNFRLVLCPSLQQILATPYCSKGQNKDNIEAIMTYIKD